MNVAETECTKLRLGCWRVSNVHFDVKLEKFLDIERACMYKAIVKISQYFKGFSKAVQTFR